MGNDSTYKVGVVFDAQGVGATVSGAEKIDKAITKAEKSASGAMSSFAGNIASNAISNLTSLALEGGKAILDYSSRMEQTKIGFETLMGGAGAATKHLDELKKFAVGMPFEFESLAKMSARLQGVGVGAQKVIPLMRDIGNIAASTGDIAAERLEGINTAISQIISKSKVSAEEMEQLAERGVPAWQILSEAMGKSQAEVRKLSEQGKISSDEFVSAFSKISRKRFGDAMAKQSRTFSGVMSNSKDIVMQSAATFQPLYDEIGNVYGQICGQSSGTTAGRSYSCSQTGYALGKAFGDAYRRGVGSQSGSVNFEVPGANLPPGLVNFLGGLGAGFVEGLEEKPVVNFAQAVAGMKESVTQDVLITEEAFKSLSKRLESLNSNAGFFATEITRVKSALASSGSDLTTAQELETTQKLSKIKADGIREQIDVQAHSFAEKLKLYKDAGKDATEVVVERNKVLFKLSNDLYIQEANADKKIQDLKRKSLDERRKAAIDFNSLSIRETTQNLELQTSIAGENYSKLIELTNNSYIEISRVTRENFDKQLEDAALSREQRTNLEKQKYLELQNLAAENSQNLLRIEEQRHGKSVEMFKEEFDSITALYKSRATFFSNIQSAFFQNNAGFGDGWEKFGKGILTDVGREIAINERLKNVLAGKSSIYMAQKDLLEKTHLIERTNLEREIDLNKDLIGLERMRGKAVLQTSKINFETKRDTAKTQDDKDYWQAQIDAVNNILNSKTEDLNIYLDNQSATVKKLNSDIQNLGVTLENLKIGQAGEKQDLFAKSTEGLKELYAAIEAGQKDSILSELEENAVRQDRVKMALEIRQAQLGGASGQDGSSAHGAKNWSEDWLGLGKLQTDKEIYKGLMTDLKGITKDTFGEMTGAIGQSAAAWLIYGESVGATLGEATAAIMSNIAAQAIGKAAWEVAEGIAMSALFYFTGNPKYGASATAHFAAAAAYGALGLGAAGIGRVASGGGSSSSQSGSPDYYTSNPSSSSGNYSNVNVRTTDSVTHALETKLDRLSSAVEGLHDMVKTARPGDILERAIGEKRGLISKTVTDEFKTNSTSKKAFQETINLK